MRAVSALISDAKRGEAESGGGDASQVRLVRIRSVAAIAHDSGVGVGLLPEEFVIRLFDSLEESLVHLIERAAAGARRGFWGGAERRPTSHRQKTHARPRR